MHKPKVYRPFVICLVGIYGVGYGAGDFKEVPTKALSLMATASSTTSAASFKMPDMINHSKEYDLRPSVKIGQPATIVWPST